jgi:hypothetical protein
MYNIFITLVCLYAIERLATHPIVRKMRQALSKAIYPFITFFKFVSENNPLLLTYYEDEDKDEDEAKDEAKDECLATNNETKTGSQGNLGVGVDVVRYENKYLEKFKSFPSDYVFNELELEEEKTTYERLTTNYKQMRENNISRLETELREIKKLCEKIGNGIDSPENKKLLLEFNEFTVENEHDYDYDYDYEEFVSNIHFDELYQDVINKRTLLEEELKEATEKIVTEEEIRLKARNVTINNKLNGYINSYVLEHTPLGNIYMRYNNDKNSFEYFSNNTIPYRYLEPVGRKYVMTYWCKPIFVDAEAELKQAEIRFDEEKKKREEEDKRKREEIIKNPRNVLARMKDYNKETKSQTIMSQSMKNRTQNNVLPPQIKANLVHVNQTTEKQLLKEHSNRYTWEGRLTGFCPLKKVDKKKLCSNLNMSYADYKRWQKEKEERIME